MVTVPRSMVAELQSAQASAADLAVLDLRDAWAQFDLSDPVAVRNALLEVAPAVVEVWGQTNAVATADWYELARENLNVQGGALGVVGAVPHRVLMERQVRFGAQHLWTDTPNQTLKFLEGSLIRYVMDAGRDSIIESVAADPETTGWQRIATPDACKFCQFLAANGDVYRTMTTATFAAHDNCMCAAVPSWDPDAKEVPVRVYKASHRKTLQLMGPTGRKAKARWTPEKGAAARREHLDNIKWYLSDFE